MRQFCIFLFMCMCICVLCMCVWLYTCFLQSGQLIWVPLAGVLMCHWGSFETVSQVHWVGGDALQCTATLGRNGPCGRQAGAYDQSGAAQYLQGPTRKGRMCGQRTRGKVQAANFRDNITILLKVWLGTSRALLYNERSFLAHITTPECLQCSC